jgi:DNA-binding transcriptional regulator GbsR (MarR family)
MNNGKGDSPRNCFSQHYRENYDHIFNTITGEDWRREIQRGRQTKNKIKERIREEFDERYLKGKK